MSIELLPAGVKCNLSCPYCYQSEMREAGNFSPGYDLEAMKRGLEKENYRFTLFGGEPLLMPIKDLEEIWRWGLEKFGSNSVQTNGTLITEAHLDLFKKYQVSVGMSMDGPDELNDSRWAGTLEKTRAATKNSQAAIEALCATGRPPSLIVTLYRGNAVGDRLPRLKGWLAQLDRQGVKHARLHLLEIEDADVRAQQALTDDENVTALLDLMAFQDSLTGMRFDLFADMVNLLLGRDDSVSCIWSACDPYTTRAVRGVNGVGDNVNCGRTNKDGVDFGKADVEGFERQLVLHETPYEQGGCKDCRFFAQCKGQCYSDDTEVLTRRGFVLFRDLQPMDELATLEPSTGVMTYATPTNIIRYQFAGELLHFQAKGYDLLVTPDHPMLAWNKRGHMIEARAEEIESYDLRLKKDALWQGVEVTKHALVRPPTTKGKEWCTPIVDSVPMDRWLEFLGWFIAEGSTNCQPQARGWLYDVSIGQKEKCVIDRLDEILTDAGFHPCIRAGGVWKISVKTRQLYKELVPLGKALRKHVPNYVKNLSARQIRIFLGALFGGDGTSRGAGRARDGEERWECYYTSSRRLADDVQELLLKCGLSSTINVRLATNSNIARAKRETFSCNADAYEIYVRHAHHEPTLVPAKHVAYSGEVFDVTMPGSPTIYVRRNGKTVWGHNCPGTAIDGDWRNRSEQCQVWFRVFEKLEADLVRAGRVPLSLSPLRPKLEAAMIASWRAGRNMSIAQAVQIATGQAVTANLGDRDHGDHWDAGDNFLHADGAEYLHGDHGTTEYHGDGPHGDVPHGDS